MARDNKNTPGLLVIKCHNIRIWCHDCDMGRLQRVVWEGHGSRLLSEVSNQPVVKKFLEAVPYIMNTIRDIHTAVVQNDLEGLMKHAGDPVPPLALSSRDANNMTVMHKAAGLGHGGILKYIAERYPQGINDVDNDGRTPLHYAAAMRDDQHTYNTLVSLGADESVVDNKNKTPAYYINRPQEIDKNLFKTLPDAPRTPSSAYPTSWDWKLLDTEVIAELNKKSRRRNHKASNENISSKDTNTITASESTDIRIGGMKGSSTHELIHNLPELDDAKHTKDDIENHIVNVESNKESEVVEENQEHEEDEANEANAEEATEEHEEKVEDSEEAVEHVQETTEDKEKSEHNPEKTTDHVEEAAENTEEATVNVEESAAETHHEADNDENSPEVEHDEKGVTEGEKAETGEDKGDTEAEKSDTEVEKDVNNTHVHEVEDEASEKTAESNEERTKTPQQPHEEETKEENEEIVSHNANHENENHTGETGEHESHQIEEIDSKGKETNHENESNEGEEHDAAAANEGNAKNGEHGEDDDDVQVPGETQSEYSDSNLKSTAELSDMGSAKRGKAEISSGTIHETIKI